MDDTIRLKTKICENEFEGEGSAEYVREQYQAWQELVKLAVAAQAGAQPPATQRQNDQFQLADGQPLPPKQDAAAVDSNLQKIMRVENRAVSLTARLTSVHDAVLIMLYGQKIQRNNDAVTGAELLTGLAASGGFSVSRLDRILDKLAEDGDVMAFGERRGKRYRLTNTGIAKARQIASDLIATVA